ncbi:MAG TPA: phosphomannomutase/phosphoglucomutase, partial [Herpetosiphonaceae bacterium]|nr:phosphomannomutase/phosphoglucomutase [Herpetosiphonaceae bacterium]
FQDFNYADSGVIPSLIILEMLSKKGKKMSELLAPLEQTYHISGEINTRVNDVKEVIAKLAERYHDADHGHMDGLSITYPDWHFNVRGSNTEPLLRLNLEARTKALMEQKRDEVLKIIRE